MRADLSKRLLRVASAVEKLAGKPKVADVDVAEAGAQLQRLNKALLAAEGEQRQQIAQQMMKLLQMIATGG